MGKKNGKKNRLKRLRASQAYCCYCGLPRDKSIEHLYPQDKGGNNSVFNTRVACVRCNQEKNNMTPDEYVEFLKKKLARAIYYQNFTNLFKEQMIGFVHINDDNPNTYFNVQNKAQI